MLDRAKFLLVSELAEVEGKTAAVMEERVDRALSKTFGPTDPSGDEEADAEARGRRPQGLGRLGAVPAGPGSRISQRCLDFGGSAG